tara:strand:+ start:86 stop:1030 length:945 start_codon:yes stop_codon:yes gene_type:complete
MWFNNALVFHFEIDDASKLQEHLRADPLKPCPPHARFIYGWLPAYADEMVHEVAGSQLICMGKEERILPRGVIQKILSEKIQTWEAQNNRAMKRAEKAQMAEELEFELLPKSFTIQKRQLALFDLVSERLIINTASANQAAQLTSLLRKSVPGLSIEPLEYECNLSNVFAEWIQKPHTLPKNFELASDCLLFSPDDDKKKLNCKGYELPADEILTLLSQGLAPAEISLVWCERIQFTLTQDLIIKRMKCMDYLVDEFHEIGQLEEEYEQQDASLTLLTGELRALINDLLASINSHKDINQPSHVETTAINEATV